jgi:Secreted repeat of unknown function
VGDSGSRFRLRRYEEREHERIRRQRITARAKLGTIHRADGATQMIYHGHPLYYFAGDSAAGQAHGEGSKAFGADWYVVAASGKKIDND